MRFRAEIELGGKTATGIRVPAEVVEGLGRGKRPPVKVTINGYTYRSTVAVMGGAYMVGVSEEVRGHAGVKAGDVVDVDMELDTEKREVELPPEIAELLAADEAARRFFEGLSFTNKRVLVEPIGQAKTPETRQRRVEKAIEALKAGRV